MTDKEFKKLNRAQLIDIIYQLQLQVDQLIEQKQSLEKALADKRLCIDNAGNIAEAALALNDCFRCAQNAADQYLKEIKVIRSEVEAERQKILAEAEAERQKILAETEAERQKILAETEAERQKTLDEARTGMAAIVARTRKTLGDYDSAIEAILKEYGKR